jgi:hypothetical protein
MRNDFFSIEGGNGGSIWSDIVTIRDGYDEDDPYWEFAGRPGASNLRELFHDVNRVDVRLVPSYETSAARRKGRAPPEEMRVWFDAFGRNNFTPNLDHFLVQVNGGAWNVSSGDLAFQPRRGVNRILVRAVNKFGVQGPVSSCDIAWMPGATPLPQLPLEAWESEGEAPT